VTDAVDALGDRYSLPLVRELFYGNHRFSDLVSLVGAPRTLLSGRLRKLEELGVIERRRYSQHPPRDEYLLTEAGRDLLPVLIALREWGDRYCHGLGGAGRLKFRHRCGKPLQTKTVCSSCGKEIRFEDLVVTGNLRPVKQTMAKVVRASKPKSKPLATGSDRPVSATVSGILPAAARSHSSRS
jgi:DNA-binding HxlR family transcriptional regulator